MAQKVPDLKLNNGIIVPQFGLGVYKAQEGEEVEQAVMTALEVGYRLIDTAAVYRNEEGVGRAIAASGLPRDEIFITTKLWNDDQGYDTARPAFERSLQRLGLEYVDLYLLHWPVSGKYVDSWRALEEIYKDGQSRAIGVSNFMPQHLDKLIAETEVVPAVNQIELHPYLTQNETRNYCDDKGIVVESWSPIMRAGEILDNPVIVDIAGKYNKTAAQVILRWHIELGLVVIPKSVTPERIRSNIDIFDFELTQDEVNRISNLNVDQRIGPDPREF